jgi:hypothetical protein
VVNWGRGRGGKEGEKKRREKKEKTTEKEGRERKVEQERAKHLIFGQNGRGR